MTENIIVKVGRNGGYSIISVELDNFKCLSLGKDSKIRIEFNNASSDSFPIVEILKADDYFIHSYEELLALV